MYIKSGLISILLLIGISNNIFSNNVTVSNVNLTDQDTANNYTMVNFDVSWDNSWRISTNQQNWDAVWVFVKYRLKNQTFWQHASLNWVDGTGATDGHTIPANCNIESANDNGNGNAYGVFVYRNADMAQASVNYSGIKLRWEYGDDLLQDEDSVEICVFAIEMVYVPQASYYLGSGGASEYNGFYQYPNRTDEYHVTSEAAITVGSTAGNLNYADQNNYEGDHNGPIPAAFPKGYNDFYCMKYEISHEQYAMFLNKLTYAEQNQRTASIPSYNAGRGALYNNNATYYRSSIDIEIPGVSASPSTPAVYTCNLNANANFGEPADGQNIACNYLSVRDWAAYLDWAALRPMSELEYEKAGRGTLNAIGYEYAWGSMQLANVIYTLSNSGANNEGIATNYDAVKGNASYNTTDGGINGPVRCGIFAANAANNGRVTSGASYYGIMELSGNLWEWVISVADPDGRNYTAVHGDGKLNSSGNYNVSHWPSYNSLGYGIRGGSWYDAHSYMRISDRYWGYASNYSSRTYNYGGRGVRTAP